MSSDEVIRADLIIIGDQSGCADLTIAASPAMCGLDIDVPLRKSKSRPESGGALAASMSTPGAMMSGLSRSAEACNGPRDENAATCGASGSEPLTRAVKEPVGSASFST